MPLPTVSTVTVAYPLAKSKVALATGVPLGATSCAFSSWEPAGAADVGAVGAVEPVHTGGSVPGTVLACCCGEHAARARAGTENQTAATVAGLTMAESLSGHRDDHPRRLVGERGNAGRNRRLQQLAHLVGGLLFARRITEEHCGLGHIGEAEVADVGHVPSGLLEPVGGAARHALVGRDVVDTHVGLPRGRGRRRCRT